MAKPIRTRFNYLFKILFLCVFLCSGLYFQANLGGDGLHMPFNNVVWICACFLIGLGVYRVLVLQEIKVPWLLPFLLALLVSTALAGYIAPSSDPVSWLFRSLALWGGVLFFLALHQFLGSQKVVEYCLCVILVAAFVQGGIGYLQVIWTGLPKTWLPYSNGLPVGIFQQYSVAAIFQATGLTIGLYLISRPGFQGAAWAKRSVIFLSAFVASVLIAYSGSRAGIVGAVSAIVLLFVFRFRFLLKRQLAVLIWCTVVVGGSVYGTQYGTSKIDYAVEKLQGGAGARATVYGISFELFKEAPWFGHGVGSFESIYQEKKPGFLARHPDYLFDNERISHPHNELLYWLVEGGLFAVSGILVALFGYLWLLFRLGFARGGAYLALTAPLALHALVEFPFYVSAIHWLLFLFLVALASSHYQKSYRVTLSSSAQKLIAGGLFVVLPVASFFFVHTLVASRQLTEYVILSNKNTSKLSMGENNIYLWELAEYLRMQTFLEFARRRGDRKTLELYVQWAERKLETLPDIVIYGSLSLAHHLLGNEDASEKVLKHAFSIYPEHQMLKKYQGLIESSSQLEVIYYEGFRGNGWEAKAIMEHTDIIDSSSKIHRFYRGGLYGNGIGYAWSYDGINFVKYPGNPIINNPANAAQADGIFSYALTHDGQRYLFVSSGLRETYGDVYAYDVSNPYFPMKLNGGKAISKGSAGWASVTFNHGSVVTPDGKLHMLIEGKDGVGGDFNLGYQWAWFDEILENDGSVSLLNTNRSEVPVIPLAGNPQLIHVPERNALLAIYGSIEKDYWDVRSAIAYLDDDLTLPESWHQKQVLVSQEGQHTADPSVLFSSDVMVSNGLYPMILSYSNNQISPGVASKWSGLNRVQFFDALVEGRKIAFLTVEGNPRFASDGPGHIPNMSYLSTIRDWRLGGSATLSEVTGELLVDGGDDAPHVSQAFSGDSSKGYSVRLGAQRASNTSRISVVFRYIDDSNFSRMYIDGDELYYSERILGVWQDPVFVGAVFMSELKRHAIRVDVLKEKNTFYVDDANIGVVDSSQRFAYGAFKIGVSGLNSITKYSDLYVYAPRVKEVQGVNQR